MAKASAPAPKAAAPAPKAAAVAKAAAPASKPTPTTKPTPAPKPATQAQITAARKANSDVGSKITNTTKADKAAKAATDAATKASQRRADEREAAVQARIAEASKKANDRRKEDKAAADKTKADKAARDKAARDKAARDKAAKDKAAREAARLKALRDAENAKKLDEEPKDTPSEPESYGGYGGGTSSSTVTPVKSAPIDTVVFVDDQVSRELMIDLLFEDVGGQELLTIARNDTVNGQETIYQPFKNLGVLQEIYNPTSLLMLQETSDKIFANFVIDLRDKIPKVGSGKDGANYYLDMTTGNGVIELINLKPDEQIEVQIATAGIIKDIGI